MSSKIDKAHRKLQNAVVALEKAVIEYDLVSDQESKDSFQRRVRKVKQEVDSWPEWKKSITIGAKPLIERANAME